MKRPARLRILGKRFSVEYVNDVPLESEDLGECDTDAQVIHIREGQNPQAEQHTVFHECLEAINEFMKIKLKHDQIEQLEVGIMQLIQENPSLISYLRSNGTRQV